MVVDFRKTRTTLCCVSILGEEVEVVERHKYSYFKSYCYFRQLASWLPRHQQTTVVLIVGLMYSGSFLYNKHITDSSNDSRFEGCL